MLHAHEQQQIFQQKIVLLFSTMFDIVPYQSDSEYKKLSLYGFKKLINRYQIQNNRTLIDEVCFYILGSALDQGYIDADKKYNEQEQKLIQKVYTGNQKHFTEIKQKLSKTNIEKTEIVSKLGYAQLIQKLQQQYYRQKLTLKRVQETFQKYNNLSSHKCFSTKQLAFQIIQKMDSKGDGQIFLKDIVRYSNKHDGGILKHKIKKHIINNSKNQPTHYTNYIKNKLLNNVHTQKSHKKSIKFLKVDLQQLPLTIQNIVQLFYRISNPNKSLTYQFITDSLSSTQKQISQKMNKIKLLQDQKIKKLTDKNNLVKQMEDIKDIVRSIVYKQQAHQQQKSSIKQYISQVDINNKYSYTPKPLIRNKTVPDSLQPLTQRHQPNYIEYSTKNQDQKTAQKPNKIMAFETSQKKQENTQILQYTQNRQQNSIHKNIEKPSKQKIHQRVLEQLQKIKEQKIKNKLEYYKILGL